MPEEKKNRSLLSQIAVLFVVGAALIWGISTYSLHKKTIDTVTEQLIMDMRETALDTAGYINRYPSSEWLLEYWYENCRYMDIEYDVGFEPGTETEVKCRKLTKRNPDFQIPYATVEDVAKLSRMDQKIYAEIIYAWLIDRIDLLKEANGVDYLFGTVTEEPYEKQTALFISAGPDNQRGVGKGMAYAVGKELNMSESQQESVSSALKGQQQLTADRSGKYMDYYHYLGKIAGRDYLIGVTRNYETILTSIQRQTYAQSLVTALSLILLTITCLLMIQIAVLKPLEKIRTNMRLYRDTKDSRQVAKDLSMIKTHNELMEVSADLVDLTREMDHYTDKIKKITSEKERIETELNLANEIQMAALPQEFPPYPSRKDFDLYASMDPAREVGGDFYDFFLIDEDHLYLLMADVSGKGVPAALFMMAAKITLTDIVNTGRSPGEILKDVNNSLYMHNPSEMFVTAWLGILDLKTGILKAANAGHEYPIVKKGDGDFKVVRDEHGFVLGGMEDSLYREYEISLDPGSKIFLYTDGLLEASDEEGNMFGTERTLEELNRTKDESPKEIIENIKAKVQDFVNGREAFDDLTLMCVVYNGKKDE